SQARVAVMEAPVQVRAGEGEPAEGRLDVDVQCGARLGVAAVGQPLLLAPDQRPARGDRVAELEPGPGALEAARADVVAMRQPRAEQLRHLVELRAAQ